MISRWREAIVPSLYTAVVLLTFRGYGLTWDESVQHRYGELALQWFAGRGDAVNRFLDLRYYGALFEMLAVAFARVAPLPWYDARHLCIAATGVLAVVGAGRFAARCGGEPVVAQLALVCMPQFYGHAFNNSKDVPFACAAVWLFVAFAGIADGRRWPRALLAGVALGAALSIRVGALILLGIAILAVARSAEALLRIAIATVSGWTVMVVTWPWAQSGPIGHPLIAFARSLSFPALYPVLFEGSVLRSDALPRRYLLEMLAITTPLATLLLALGGLALAARRMRQTPELVLVLWVALPVISFVVTRPNVYDGIRHFLFLLPALAVCASLAVAALPRGTAVVLLLPIVAMVRLHPYQATYYNALAGGTGGASTHFETDYWASSYREAALWLRAHPAAGRRTRVLVAANAYSEPCLSAYLPSDRFEVARTMAHGLRGPVPFDYYVATTRYRLDANFREAPVVEAVARDGALFAVVRAINHSSGMEK